MQMVSLELHCGVLCLFVNKDKGRLRAARPPTATGKAESKCLCQPNSQVSAGPLLPKSSFPLFFSQKDSINYTIIYSYQTSFVSVFEAFLCWGYYHYIYFAQGRISELRNSNLATSTKQFLPPKEKKKTTYSRAKYE